MLTLVRLHAHHRERAAGVWARIKNDIHVDEELEVRHRRQGHPSRRACKSAGAPMPPRPVASPGRR